MSSHRRLMAGALLLLSSSCLFAQETRLTVVNMRAIRTREQQLAAAQASRLLELDNWLQFSDGETAITQSNTRISTANVTRLQLLYRIMLPEKVDGSPVYTSGIVTGPGRLQDLLIMSTGSGALLALDARDGALVWQQAKPAAGVRWTTSSPVVDRQKKLVYVYGTDGYIHRHFISTGEEDLSSGWPQLVTRKPDVEKGSSALRLLRVRDGTEYLYMPVAGYPIPGDEGDYQGHLTTINVGTGRQKVFNVNCSNRSIHFGSKPAEDCPSQQAGIWARAGVAYDEETDRVFITAGNGVFDGHYNWADSVIALHPDGSSNIGVPVDSYTPVEFQKITDLDLDLSSTTVAVLPRAPGSSLPRMGLQSGKDTMLRLLALSNLNGSGAPGHLGGELQVVPMPQGHAVHTRPVTRLDADGRPWAYIANRGGVSAVSVERGDDGKPVMKTEWVRKDLPGTSPILVNGVLFFADDHEIRALDPTTGEMLWHDQSVAEIHWSTPIVANDALYLTDEAGYLSVWALP